MTRDGTVARSDATERSLAGRWDITGFTTFEFLLPLPL
jgi:hypothetical protein